MTQSKNIIICFDGTTNKPEDSEQDILENGAPDDDSITNISKLFLMLGGTKPGGANDVGAQQVCFYYSGVGSEGKMLKRFVNYALSPKWLDVADILTKAGKNLNKVYDKKRGDKIFLFGFSRGAALARRFAATLHRYIDVQNTKPVEFMGLFDTVARVLEGPGGRYRASVSDVRFTDTVVSSNVKSALHLVSLDDKRKLFAPVLMSPDDRLTEVWFPGGHSDVGGGYYHDGLSDLALQFMLDELHRHHFGLTLIAPSQIDFHATEPIDYDDVMMAPSACAGAHVQRNLPFVRDHRSLRVEGSESLPLVHHSIPERIQKIETYRPKSLKRTPHHIYYHPDKIEPFNGLADHVGQASDPLRALKEGEQTDSFRIYANHPSNKTFLSVRKGEKYVFHLEESDDWYDRDIKCTPAGWTRKEVQLGLKEIPIAVAETLRRHPDANWMELCGEITNPVTAQSHIFSAFDHRYPRTHGGENIARPFIAPFHGILTLFANDLPVMYGNNRGFVTVRIERKA